MLKKKKELIEKFSRSPRDTGSPEVQVALFTNRIVHLTEHFKIHKKDNHGRRGLMKLVNARHRLLSYLKSKDVSRYNSLIKALDMRK